MAAVGGVLGGYLPSEFRPTPPPISSKINDNRRIRLPPPPPPPLFISTDPSHVNHRHLRDLYSLCNHSCHRFPAVDADGRVDPVDIDKLRIALSHSYVVVSVFSKPEVVSYYSSSSSSSSFSSSSSNLMGVGGDWFRQVVPVTPSNGQLVGFGRAVSDYGLTASIYDVMVIPSLRGMGIGRMIVKRIIRVLTSRGIYDIAALCSDKERLFFEASGFGDDSLGSTTMMYTRTVSSCEGNHMVKHIGRKLLLVPPIPAYLECTSWGKRKFLKMGKIWVEVCLISARGLQRTSSLFKLQWYAVGWIDPNNKYCSRIDASGNANPVWKTKFSALVDNSEAKFQDLALHVEVYSREPIFLREKLQGTATVVLKEFLDKYIKNSEVSKLVEEVGSFQLRKKSSSNSSKPQGFVDVSIRISEEREEPSSYTGNGDGFKLMDHNNGINLFNEYGMSQPHPPQFPLLPVRWPENQPTTSTYAHHMPQPGVYPNSSVGGPIHPAAGGPSYASSSGPAYPTAGGPSYQPPRTPPPPPPPSNIGFIPTFLPRTDQLPPSYINMPSSGAAHGRGGGPGFGVGLGAGALAAGAVIVGDDFMSGFNAPTGFQDASLTVVTDPPF